MLTSEAIFKLFVFQAVPSCRHRCKVQKLRMRRGWTWLTLCSPNWYPFIFPLKALEPSYFHFFSFLLPATRALHGQAAKGFLAAAVAACAAPRRPQVPAAELSLDDLNGEQQAVVHTVLKGHNVFLTGRQWLAKLLVNSGCKFPFV